MVSLLVSGMTYTTGQHLVAIVKVSMVYPLNNTDSIFAFFIFTWAITGMLRSKNESTSFFSFSDCQISIMVTGIPVTCLRSLRSIQVLCECLNSCTAQNTCEIYKISKHKSLLENLSSDIIQEYFPTKFRLLFHIKNYQTKRNQCRVMVQQYFIEEKAPFTWL